MEALIISCQEPQLKRCVESVKNQLQPFRNIIHIDNITPEHEAFKMGLDRLKSEWAMIVNGDMVLYPSASGIATEQIFIKDRSMIGEFQYGLYDPFVRRTINACSVYRVGPLKEEGRNDSLMNDFIASRNIAKKGWQRLNFFNGMNKIVIGTHFEDPTEFQIFTRFFIRGIKGDTWTEKYLHKLYDRTKEEKYSLAIKSLEFGKGKNYPGSHNINFDKEMYEVFCNRGGS